MSVRALYTELVEAKNHIRVIEIKILAALPNPGDNAQWSEAGITTKVTRNGPTISVDSWGQP